MKRPDCDALLPSCVWIFMLVFADERRVCRGPRQGLGGWIPPLLLAASPRILRRRPVELLLPPVRRVSLGVCLTPFSRPHWRIIEYSAKCLCKHLNICDVVFCHRWDEDRRRAIAEQEEEFFILTLFCWPVLARGRGPSDLSHHCCICVTSPLLHFVAFLVALMHYPKPEIYSSFFCLTSQRKPAIYPSYI